MTGLPKFKTSADALARTLRDGVRAQQAGNFRQAEFCYQSILRVQPTHPVALNLMGTLALEARKPDIASRYFRKAVKERPGDPTFLHNLASAQLLDRKPQAALEILRKAVRQHKDHVHLWLIMARAEAALSREEAALAAYDRAVELSANDTAIAVERAEMLVQCGRMAEATEVFRAAVRPEEPSVKALVGLSVAHKFAQSDPEPDLMVRALGRNDLSPKDRKALRYAAGKALANQGRHDAAFEQFATAKAEGSDLFSIDLHRDAFHRRKTLFTADFIAERQSLGSTSERPVFVVGMPRSGTTLTEQILASHPAIAGAGELPAIRHIARDMGLGGPNPDAFGKSVAALTPAAARKLANGYLAILKQHSATAERVVDKMPHNYELLGLIAILFPRARIIHSTRDPLDTCVSCFTHHFAEAHGYNADLTTLGQYYRAYSDLMAHWHRVLPGAIFDSAYEDLINDQEAASRRIVAAAGMDWDDACLSFQNTERRVATPSRWQVRQPIYKTSLKSWEKYASHLGPLRKALGQ